MGSTILIFGDGLTRWVFGTTTMCVIVWSSVQTIAAYKITEELIIVHYKGKIIAL